MSTQLSDLMKNLSLSSLEEICMLSVAKTLLIEDSARKIFRQHFSLRRRLSNDFEGTDEIISLCKALHIPEIIETKLLCVLHWVTQQYFDWIYFVVKELRSVIKLAKKRNFINHVMDSVIWGSNGTVNYQLSIHRVISLLQNVEDDKSLMLMFKIASKYCLEDDVKLLWSKLPHHVKDDIFQEKNESCSNCFFNDIFESRDRDLYYYYTFYWACLMNGEMKQFVEWIPNRLNRHIFNDWSSPGRLAMLIREFPASADAYAFIMSVFNGCSHAVDFYIKSPQFETIDAKKSIEIYLELAASRALPSPSASSLEFFRNGWQCRPIYEDAVVLRCLLNNIQDDDFVNGIFTQYSDVFLQLSAKYLPWRKFLVSFVKISSYIDQDLFRSILRNLLGNLRENKVDMFLIKNLWKNAPNNVKELFCYYVSKNQDFFFRYFKWEDVMMIEVIDMFLREEKLKEILTPYGNNSVIELIYMERFDVVNHWVKKCLITEEAIILFMENFILTRSNEIIGKLMNLKRINEFLEWTYKYEDKMNKEKISKAKDETMKQVLVSFIIAIKSGNWNDSQKFLDWILKNGNGCEDKLISFKREVLQELFKTSEIKSWREVDFIQNLRPFLSYGISNHDKFMIMMNEIDLNEGEICRSMCEKDDLEKGDLLMNIFIEFGRDIWKIKQNILIFIFSSDKEYFLENITYQNIEKLLTWNSGMDLNTKKKILEIKKAIIDLHGLENIIKCILRNRNDALNNLLNFLLSNENGWCTSNGSDPEVESIILKLKKDVLQRLLCKYSTQIIYWEKHIFERFDKFFLLLHSNGKHLKKDIIEEYSVKICVESLVKGNFNNVKPFLDWAWNDGESKTSTINVKRNILSEILGIKLFDNWCKDNIYRSLNSFLYDYQNPDTLQIATMKLDLVELHFPKIFSDFLTERRRNHLKKFIVWAFDERFKSYQFLPRISKLSKEIFEKFGKEYCLFMLSENDWRGTAIFWNLLDFQIDAKNKPSLHGFKEDCIEEILTNELDENCPARRDIKNFRPCLNFFISNSNTLKSKREIREFKDGFIDKYGPDFCNAWIFANDWEKLENFLNWSFESYEDNEREEKIINFKTKTIGLNTETSYKDHLEIFRRFYSYRINRSYSF